MKVNVNAKVLWIMLGGVVATIVVTLVLMRTDSFDWNAPSSDMWLINYTSPVESQSIYGGGTEFPLPSNDDQSIFPTRQDNSLSPPRGEGRVLYHRSRGLYGPDLSRLELPTPYGRCSNNYRKFTSRIPYRRPR